MTDRCLLTQAPVPQNTDLRLLLILRETQSLFLDFFFFFFGALKCSFHFFCVHTLAAHLLLCLHLCLFDVFHQVASGQQEGERLAIAGLQPGLPITTPFIAGAHLPSYLAASALEREAGSAHNPLLQHMALLEQSQNPLVSGTWITLRLGLYLLLTMHMYDGFHDSG